jgi:hypothetical protein
MKSSMPDRSKPNQLNVELEPALLRRVRMYKAETGNSVRWLVTVALTQFLDRYDKQSGRNK